MQIPLLVLSLILAAVFAALAVPKVTGQSQMRERMAHLAVSVGLTKAIGTLEGAAAIGLIVGLFWAPAGIAAAVGLTLQMIGATVYHLRAKDPMAVASMPLVFGLASAALAVLHLLNG
ncbi:DoxX family protein [Micromonospora sp. B11E3]|uniref:DoxX family protein n=1 Tax=Micromonospora sp. B11E3 TaxID=3153562 RepID=UPI00325D3050